MKKKIDKEFLKRFITVGSMVFLVLMVIIYFVQITRGFNFWDEFGHWGPMVKESLRLNKFYSVPESTLQRHKDYPPFFTMLELLWCYFNDSYSEGIIFVATTTFSVSLFMPLFKKYGFNKKGIINSIITVAILFFLLLTIGLTPNASDTAHFFNSVYMDWPMAIFLAFTFYLIYTDKKEFVDDLMISSCFVSLLMMKQMGLPFYLLCLFLLILNRFVISDDKKFKIRYLLLFIIIPIAFYFGWDFYIKSVGLANYAQFKISDISVSRMLEIVQNNGETNWQTISFVNYLDAILNRKLVVHPVSVSYFIYAIFISLCVLFTGYKDHKKWSISISYLLGSAGYALAMMLLYCFCFGPSEGPQLASFDRYLITYLFFGNCLLIYLLVDKYYDSLLILIVVLVLVLPFVEFEDLKNFNYRECLFGDNAIANYLDYPIEEDKQTLVIQQNIEDVNDYAIFGYINGNNVDVYKFGIPEWEGDRTVNIDINEFNEFLGTYDYVYIESINEYFDIYYNETLHFVAGSLYKNSEGDFIRVN
ncbi:MAG: hypothetical protein Q4B60_00335 [Erysipelotrichaceae bacterium]|nr:hypothetical protein [Erysipelotrichaceae bacterium]